jgi:hypothetical protein
VIVGKAVESSNWEGFEGCVEEIVLLSVAAASKQASKQANKQAGEGENQGFEKT